MDSNGNGSKSEDMDIHGDTIDVLCMMIANYAVKSSTTLKCKMPQDPNVTEDPHVTMFTGT